MAEDTTPKDAPPSPVEVKDPTTPDTRDTNKPVATQSSDEKVTVERPDGSSKEMSVGSLKVDRPVTTADLNPAFYPSADENPTGTNKPKPVT